MIHVIATVRLKPGTRAAYLEEFRKLTPLVRAEAGCAEYQATVDVPSTIGVQEPPQPDQVTVVEKWASLDALYAHLKAPHMADYRAAVKDYIAGVSLRITEPV